MNSLSLSLSLSQPSHLLPVHRKRSRAVAHDHANRHDALRREKDISPNDVFDVYQGPRASPPKIRSHANEIHSAASADPPRGRSNLDVLGLKYVPRPVW